MILYSIVTYGMKAISNHKAWNMVFLFYLFASILQHALSLSFLAHLANFIQSVNKLLQHLEKSLFCNTAI